MKNERNKKITKRDYLVGANMAAAVRDSFVRNRVSTQNFVFHTFAEETHIHTNVVQLKIIIIKTNSSPD